jgi:hypothetical protein
MYQPYTVIYSPGNGYTVRDAYGRVLGSKLSPCAKDAIIASIPSTVTTGQLLASLA